MDKESLKSYKIAQKLRSAAARCTRTNSEVALLCEHAITAAEWLEKESDDAVKLLGAVTHNALMGRATIGCIVHEYALELVEEQK